jgi:hypothetical protein
VGDRLVKLILRIASEAIGAGGLVTVIVSWTLLSVQYWPLRLDLIGIVFSLGVTATGFVIFGFFAALLVIPLVTLWIGVMRLLAVSRNISTGTS